MSSSPPPFSSSSLSSTSVPETPPSSSSSSPLPPLLSLRSPELQAEFLQECRSRFRFQSDVGEAPNSAPLSPSSPLPSPFSSATLSPSSPLPSPFNSAPGSASSSASSSPRISSRPASVSMISPELLTELKEGRSLRKVTTNQGMTTVFSGRGRGRGQVSGSASSTRRTNQKSSP